MKKLTVSAIVLVLLFTMVGSAGAAIPAPGGPFTSSFAVQNMDSVDVTCSYTIYNSTGGVAYSSGTSSAIAPGEMMYVYLPSIGSLGAGAYSAVVSCSGEVAAVSTYSDANSISSYSGIQSPGTTWYIAGLYDDYYDYYSTVIVQNTTSSAVDITLTIKQGTSLVKTQQALAVPAHGYATFEQEGLAELAADNYYSGIITATGDVAPVVSIYGQATKDMEMYSYNPIKAGATTYYAAALFNGYYGYNSSLTVQNMGSFTTHVTITFHPSDGLGNRSVAFDLAAGAAITGFIPATGTSPALPSGNIPAAAFPATVVSTGTGGNPAQNINILINENTNYRRAASFDGFQSASSSAFVPYVMVASSNFNTSITCTMISGGPATMTFEFFDSAGGSDGSATSPSIANNQVLQAYVPGLSPGGSPLPAGWMGSAKVTSSGQFICVGNSDQNLAPYDTTSMDQLSAYEGIPPAP